jgi:phage tail sheath protein FI
LWRIPARSNGRSRSYGYLWTRSNQPLLGVIGLKQPLTARIDGATSEVNLLNEHGITTVFNSYGTGLRLWSNRTAAWPSVTHMRNFENVRRTDLRFLPVLAGIWSISVGRYRQKSTHCGR